MKNSKDSRNSKKVPQGPAPVRKVKKDSHGPVPCQLSTPKRPASSPKESETPKRNRYSPGNSPSFSSVASSPQNCPSKDKATRKQASESSSAPVPYDFSKRTSRKSTVKLCKALTFTTKKVDPPKFTFSLTPPSLREIDVPSSPSDFPLPPLALDSPSPKRTTSASSISPTRCDTPATHTNPATHSPTPDITKRSSLLPNPTSNDKVPSLKTKTYKNTPDIPINDSQIASTSNTNTQTSTAQKTHSHSKNISSFYTHFELKDWESERVIISQLEKEYPQLEVSYIGKHNTSIAIKVLNKQSFIVLANISSLSNKKVKFVPKEPFTPTLTSIVANVPITTDPKRLLSIPQIISVERIHKWDPINKTKTPTNNIKVGYQALQIPSQITLDTTTYEIRRYTPAPAVCGKCCRIGHQAYSCKAPTQFCHICTGPHPKKSCPNPNNKKCINCGKAHSANYRGCLAIKEAARQIASSIQPQPLMQIRTPQYPPSSYLNPYFPPPRCPPAHYPQHRYPPQHSTPLQSLRHPLHEPPRHTHPVQRPTYAAMANCHQPAMSTPRLVQQTKTPQSDPAPVTQSLNKDTQHQSSQNAHNQNKETQHQRPRSVHQTQSPPNLNKETQHQKPNPASAKLNKTQQPIPKITPSIHKNKYPIVQRFSKTHSLEIINNILLPALNQAIKQPSPLTNLFQILLVTLQSAHANLRSVHGPPTREQMEMNLQEFINSIHLIFKELPILTLS